MQQYPRIWFLRHGETTWNREHRLQGQLDSPLTAQGEADAARQARLIAPVLLHDPNVVVSPLGRTVRTAEIALRGTPYRTDDRLMEIHAGAWQGRLKADILAENPALADAGSSPLAIFQAAEGGEGVAAFEARIIEFLQELTQPTVLVAHGLLGQVMRAHIRGLDREEAGHLSNHQGCVYVLEDGQETILEGDL